MTVYRGAGNISVMQKISFAFLALVALAATAAEGRAVFKNWFNDPFFQVRNGMPACPVPLGPLLTAAEMRQEEHFRVERGTSCWMEGRCAQPNAYLYDASIGKSIQDRFGNDDFLSNTSLWIAVKRRFVWVEGCVPDAGTASHLEKLIQSVPDVERVIVDVMPGTTGKPPYAVRRSGQKTD